MAPSDKSPVELETVLSGASDRIFYDGSCGLCHGMVRFVLRRDRVQGAFRFAPLNGSTFERQVPAELRRGLPDSLVVETATGRLLTRSAGVLYILRRLGGIWRLLASLADLAPGRVLDLAYDGIARLRRLLFKRPRQSCPTTDAELAGRFDP